MPPAHSRAPAPSSVGTRTFGARLFPASAPVYTGVLAVWLLPGCINVDTVPSGPECELDVDGCTCNVAEDAPADPLVCDLATAGERGACCASPGWPTQAGSTCSCREPSSMEFPVVCFWYPDGREYASIDSDCSCGPHDPQYYERNYSEGAVMVDVCPQRVIQCFDYEPTWCFTRAEAGYPCGEGRTVAAECSLEAVGGNEASDPCSDLAFEYQETIEVGSCS